MIEVNQINEGLTRNWTHTASVRCAAAAFNPPSVSRLLAGIAKPTGGLNQATCETGLESPTNPFHLSR